MKLYFMKRNGEEQIREQVFLREVKDKAELAAALLGHSKEFFTPLSGTIQVDFEEGPLAAGDRDYLLLEE